MWTIFSTGAGRSGAIAVSQGPVCSDEVAQCLQQFRRRRLIGCRHGKSAYGPGGGIAIRCFYQKIPVTVASPCPKNCNGNESNLERSSLGNEPFLRATASISVLSWHSNTEYCRWSPYPRIAFIPAAGVYPRRCQTHEITAAHRSPPTATSSLSQPPASGSCLYLMRASSACLKVGGTPLKRSWQPTLR